MDKHSANQQSISLNPITVPSLINIAIKHGVSANTLLSDVGISPSIVSNPKATIKLSQLNALYQECGKSMGDAAFGLRMGSMTRIESLNLVGSLISTSSTLSHALEHYHHFHELVHPFMNFDVHVEGKEAIVSYSPSINNEITRRYYYCEMFLAGLNKIFSELVAKSIKLNRVEFDYPQPEHASVYASVFNAPVYFQKSRSAIVFDAALLEQALPGAYPELNVSFEHQAEAYLMEIDRGKSVEKQIIRYLQENMGVRPISMQDAARRLNITTRTLQRRLKKEKTSYVNIRESIRFEHAQRYLVETSINIDEIANRLGFSEPTNFYHAFKRWADVSPGEYRRNIRKDERQAMRA